MVWHRVGKSLFDIKKQKIVSQSRDGKAIQIKLYDFSLFVNCLLNNLML